MDGRTHTHQIKQRVSHVIPGHLVWRGIKTTNHLTDTQLQKHIWIRIRMDKTTTRHFLTLDNIWCHARGRSCLPFRSTWWYFRFLWGVHTVSALFFVPFVFNSVYLFCPCYFYCLFLCNLCMAMFLNLWPFVLLLRYSFADIFITMTIILKSSWQFKCLGNIQYSGGVQTCFSLIKTPSFASFKIQYTRT